MISTKTASVVLGEKDRGSVEREEKWLQNYISLQGEITSLTQEEAARTIAFTDDFFVDLKFVEIYNMDV